MIVVADTSLFIALANIGQLDLLPRLFGRVLIPTPGAGRTPVAQATRDGPGVRGHPSRVARSPGPDGGRTDTRSARGGDGRH